MVCAPELKKAVMGVMNSIDSDLDEAIYITSDATDDAIAELDRVLIGEDEDEETLYKEQEDHSIDAVIEDDYVPTLKKEDEDVEPENDDEEE